MKVMSLDALPLLNASLRYLADDYYSDDWDDAEDFNRTTYT